MTAWRLFDLQKQIFLFGIEVCGIRHNVIEPLDRVLQADFPDLERVRNAHLRFVYPLVEQLD